MKRRGTYIAAGITAAIVLLAGLGAYRGEKEVKPGPWGSCDDPDDFQWLFEDFCDPKREYSSCQGVPEEYEDACVAGCVRAGCPARVPCTGLDPIFCASCEDMKGARFWDELNTWEIRCKYKGRPMGTLDFGPRDTWEACVQSEMEQHCPALVGKDWSKVLKRGYWPR
jgi:hypothetical protein